MKNTFIAGALGTLLLCAAADAADISGVTAADLKKASAQVTTPAEENELLYQAGAAERERVLKRAGQYLRAAQRREIPANAFVAPVPDQLENRAVYAALGAKNAAFIRNCAYWQEQIKSNYPNLAYAVKVNDLGTANRLLNYMRRDHIAVENEIAAISSNNRKAAAWPVKTGNDQAYQAGAAEREAILAQAAVCADLQGRGVPRSAFVSPTPAGTVDPARYARLRADNEAYIGNIKYWRYQLAGNYANLKDAVRVNDLETSRILLGYLKKDSADLDNEIRAVEKNNSELEGE